MILAVVGSRDFPHESAVKNWVTENHPRFDGLITGGAKGVDTWAEEAWKAVRTSDPPKVIPADWDRYGKGAGFIRNVKIITAADFIAVFWTGLSAGSLDDIGLAIGSGKPMNIYIR